jgi:hypothetical protein
MDPVLCRSPAGHSACCAQVDVRICSLSYPRAIHKHLFDSLVLKTFPSVSLSGVRNSPTVQRVSLTPSQALSKPTSSYVSLTFSLPSSQPSNLFIPTQLTLPNLRCYPCPPFPLARIAVSFFHSSVLGWEHKTNTNKLFEQYDVQKNVDILHKVVTEARARRVQRGESGSAAGSATGADTWRADLQPREAVRARTIPALERERDSLRARLAEVRFFRLFPIHSSPALNSFESPRTLGFPDLFGNKCRWRRKIWSFTRRCRGTWQRRTVRMLRRPRFSRFLMRCVRGCGSATDRRF